MSFAIAQVSLSNDKAGPVILSESDRVQVAVASLKMGESIPEETHMQVTQVIRVEQGDCVVYTGDDHQQHELAVGDMIIVPSGEKHSVVAGFEGVKLSTLYCKDASAEKFIH